MPLPRICPNCGDEMTADDIAAGRFKCANTKACVERATALAAKRMVTKPYVGFNSTEAYLAYRKAPKMGDPA